MICFPMPSFGHLSVRIWIRPFSSPGTPSQSYGRFASKLIHLDTFLSGFKLPGNLSSGVQFGTPLNKFGSGRRGRKSVWHISVYARRTFWDLAATSHIRSRSTPVDPNGPGQLKVLVLSTEIIFDAFPETTLASGRRQKDLFCRAERSRTPKTLYS